MPDALPRTEKELQQRVTKLAKEFGWLVNHIYRAKLEDGTWRTTTTLVGFPDLELIHPAWGRVMWLELKGPTGRSSPEQTKVIGAMQAVAANARGVAHAYVVKPADWPNVMRLITRQHPGATT